MNIVNLINKACTQTAVYWGNPINNGYGKFTYDPPVEISCRWEGKTQVLREWDGKGMLAEYIGIVYVLQDLDEDGCLFLGEITDLSAGAGTDPLSMETVYRIKQFEKLPRLYSTTEFVRRAFLSQWQYR